LPSQAKLFGAVGTAVEEAIGEGLLPGAVVWAEGENGLSLRKAWGNRAIEPSREPMTADTVFDVASLTKTVATATSVMILIEEGKIALRDPVVRYLPEFGAGGGDRPKVTVEHLLTHRAGLVPDDPLEIYDGTPEEIFARKHAQPLAHPPGTRFVYSDVGFEVLGELIRRVSGKPLDEFAQDRIFVPLKMKDTRFVRLVGGRPPADLPATWLARVAPEEKRDDRWMRGEVHDPRAYALGGVAGHAGLFSTAADLARYCRMILSGGTLEGARILSPAGVESMTRPRDFGDNSWRGLGWDVASAFSRNRGDIFPPGSFGHTGWTGTSFWIDPSSRAFVVFLSNRVHPDGKGDVNRLRGVVSGVVAAALSSEETPEAARRLAALVARRVEVKTGIDMLVEEGFRPIAGKKVAVLTNATGIARDGRTTIEILRSEEAKKAGVELVRVFSPEHGLLSSADEKVADSTDPGTGLPVVSLYGERRRPRPEDLAGLDAVVYDIQDVGVRFYTYITTLGYLMEEAAKAKVTVVVLDRPNPINGVAIEGPVSDPERRSFTAYHEIPVRHGMTVGELARLFNAERAIGAYLHVVRMEGWAREMWFDETGLEWVNPSPNMRSLTAATLYPGIGLLETTNLSVGRGTDTPFEVLGAPWIDGGRLAAILSARRIPGVRFTPIHFTPASSVHAGRRCGGVRFTVTDRDALPPVRLGLEIASALLTVHAADWDRTKLDALLLSRETVGRLEKGEAAGAIEATWKAALEAFRGRRAPHLLYPAAPSRP
jgi:uncharacterized protein YbbC (DUF1343 family)/CubicO group peptidase (beta-lactamase class C family)